MLPLEVVKASSELLRPLARKFTPPAVVHACRHLGISLGRWSRAAQARLPEPVVIGLKLLAAWTLLPLIVVAFVFAPGIGKLIVGAIIGAAAARNRERPQP